jgi:hypothetical protein
MRICWAVLLLAGFGALIGCQDGGVRAKDPYVAPDKNPLLMPVDDGTALQAPAVGEVLEVVAVRARGAGSVSGVVLDGELNDEVWKRAKAYPLAVAWRVNGIRQKLIEPGSVRFAWDERYLYVAAELTDLDVVAEGDQDNVLSYSTCDALELFLKPGGKKLWYWEIYGTPNGRKTVYLNPSRGRTYMASKIRRGAGVEVGAKVKGTVNNWQEKDQGWSVEMAVPVAELKAMGDEFSDAAGWRVLIGRYNHSAYHEVMGGELSTVPTLPSADFHYYEMWARLRLER